MLSLLLILFLIYNCGGGGGGDQQTGVTPAPTQPQTPSAEQIGIFTKSPTDETAFTTNSNPVTITGMGTGSISSITWKNVTTGQSGSATGTESWSVQVPLQPGDNRIEISALVGGTTQVTMPLTVTYNTSVTFTSLPQLSPDAGFTGQATVYVRIAINEPNLDPASVKVYQVDDSGNKVQLLGTLTDDGNTNNGDEIQGDGVYSVKLSLSSSTIDLIPLRIFASDTQQQESKSSVVSFAFLDEPTDEELTRESSTNRSAQDKFDELVQKKVAAGVSEQNAALQSLDELVSYIEGLPGVLVVAKGEYTVWWLNENGLTFAIDTNEFLGEVFAGEGANRGSFPAVEYDQAGIDSQKLNALPSQVKYLQPQGILEGFAEILKAAADDPYKVGSLDAIHISPYKKESEKWAASTAWTQILKDNECLSNKVSHINAAGDPVVFEGAPGPDLLNVWKELNKFGLISVLTHGGSVPALKEKRTEYAEKLVQQRFAAYKPKLQQKFPGRSDAELRVWLKEYFVARIALIHTWNNDPREYFSSNIAFDGSTEKWKAYRTEAQYEFIRRAIQQNRVILMLKKDKTNNKYYYIVLITAEFISQYNSGDFPKSIWFAAACRSASTYSMANMFRSKGGLAYMGFSDVVKQQYGVDTQRTFFDSLVNKGMKVGDAANATRAAHGAHDGGKPAYLKGQGEPLAKVVFELKNPSFDDPDGKGSMDGWKIEGDARALKKLGNASPTQGGTMAVISSGLGFTTIYGNLSQTVCLAQKAQDLIFDWNFFSEEFKEFCHRGFDDTFRVTITDKKTGAEKQLFRTSVDTLCGACNGSDVNSDACKNLPLHKSSVGFDRGEVWDTGWNLNQTVSIAEYAGKAATLKFYIEDKGDTIYDTAVLIDNIRITEN